MWSSRPVLLIRASLLRAECRHASTTCPPRAAAGITALPDRKIIRLGGVDAPKFLQGLTTNNIDTSQHAAQYTAFLNATGRLIADAFVWPMRDADSSGSWACLLDVHRDTTDMLLKHLRRHKLRSKVQIQPLQHVTVWSAWSQHDMRLSQYKLDLPEDLTDSNHCLYQPDPRLMGFASRLILPAQKTAFDSSLGVPQALASLPEATPQQYHIHRIMNGIAEGPDELGDGESQAHTLNLDFLNAIDFHKGCYVGQELTIRTQHTGVVRKRILPIQLYPQSAPVPTSLTYAPDSLPLDLPSIPRLTKIASTTSKREAGRWLGGVGNVGLALCRLETLTDLRVSAEPATYDKDAESWIRTGQENEPRVKAFVPDWLRKKLSEDRPRKPRN